MPFHPERVFIRERALDYPLTRELMTRFSGEGIRVTVLKPRQRVDGRPASSAIRGYIEAKRTLVVTVGPTNSFLPSKPSADYQLPIGSGCTGFCEYCYLQTTLGKRPYVTVFANIEEILRRAEDYIAQAGDRVVTFEGSCSSDPVPTEKYTGILEKCIRFFANQPCGRFRFVTKYTEIAPLLKVPHNGHTRFRYSINSRRVIEGHEHSTPGVRARLEAAHAVLDAGYPSGFIIAPIILENDWRREYLEMLMQIKEECGDLRDRDVTFELITHRYTDRAKDTILQVFPKTTLPMESDRRRFKRGQFGYGKYLYPEPLMEEARSFFKENIGTLFPGAVLDYFV